MIIQQCYLASGLGAQPGVEERSEGLRRITGQNDYNSRNDVFVATNLFDPSGSFTVQPRTLTFGTVPVGSTSPAQTVTITNTGASSLPIAWVGLAGADAAEFARVRNCPEVLPAAQQCTATVTFAPRTAGEQQARLVVSAGGNRKSATVNGVAD